VTDPSTTSAKHPGLGAGRRLRIGIDAHVVGRRQTGNERVLVNLIPALQRVTDHDIVAYFTLPEAAEAWRRKRLPRVEVRMLRPTFAPLRILLSLPILAVRDRLDVLLSHSNSPPLAPCPVVTLIHDVAFARHPEHFSAYRRSYMNLTMPASMRWSDGLVVVSRFTRDEVVDLYRIPPERITIALNGVDATLVHPSAPPLVDPPYFLAAGVLDPRKNLVTVVRAYRELVARRPDVTARLVIVGKAGRDAEPLRRMTEDLRRSGRIVLPGYVSDEHLAALLVRASAFVYPSVYEGFGLPPLEAMAAGVPTLVADIPVMREVVGDAAVRIAATDVEAWSRALERIVDDTDHRRALIEAGGRRSSTFTWDAQARTIAEALERAVARGRRRPGWRRSGGISTRRGGTAGAGSS